MAWAKFDDRYDDGQKVKRAWKLSRAAVGLHVMAVTYSARHALDGIIDGAWIEEKLPAAKERATVLDVLVECRLFHQLSDGSYEVHDYLDYNPSRAALEQKRAADAARKARGRESQSAGNPDGLPPDSARTPGGFPADGSADSRDRGNGPVPSPSRPGPATAFRAAVDQAEHLGAGERAHPGISGRRDAA